jgi:MFS family permease
MSFSVSAKLNLRYGPKATLIPAIAVVGLGLVLFARTPVNADYVVDILPSTLLLGLGAGLAFPSLMTLAMSGATPSDSGLASGLVNTSAQVGGALGLAVLATVASDRTESLRADGETVASALNSGFHLAYLIGVASIVVALAVAFRVLRATPVPDVAAAPDPATDPNIDLAYEEAA